MRGPGRFFPAQGRNKLWRIAMAAATITAEVHDSTNDITITSGGTPGAKAVTVILDDTKISMEDTLAIETTLRNIIAAIKRDAPIATA